MPYGHARMLGDTIDPRLAAVDYSPYVNAANIQAQSIADLGKTFAGGIDKFTEYKKKQKEDEKMVMKSQRVAQAIGDLIPDLKPTVQNSLMILEDKERPLSERVAEASAISDILAFGTQEISNRQKMQLEKDQISGSLEAQKYKYGSQLQQSIIDANSKEEIELAKRRDNAAKLAIFETKVQPVGDKTFIYDENKLGEKVDPSTGRSILDLNAYFQSGGTAGMGDVYKSQLDDNTQISPPDGIDPSSPPMPMGEGSEASNDLIGTPDIGYQQPITGDFSKDTTVRKYPAGITNKENKADSKAGNQELKERVEMSSYDSVVGASKDALNSIKNLNSGEIGAIWDRFRAGTSLASDQGKLGVLLTNIKNQNSKDFIFQLKELAGGVGQTTEKEWPRYESQFGEIKVGMDKEQMAEIIKMNTLNKFLFVKGEPTKLDAMFKNKEITQDQYDEYKNEYFKLRKDLQIPDNGFKYKDWTKLPSIYSGKKEEVTPTEQISIKKNNDFFRNFYAPK